MRLIAISGYGDQAARNAAEAAGCDNYLVKPVAPEELTRILATLV
jgi:CheY-like chemotaxis protein